MKRILWSGKTLDVVRGYDSAVRARIGFELHRVQLGLAPTDSKPMKNIGKGVREIRVRFGGEYRIVYAFIEAGTVHVLHVFRKKSGKTRQTDIELVKQRLKQAKHQ